MARPKVVAIGARRIMDELFERERDVPDPRWYN